MKIAIANIMAFVFRTIRHGTETKWGQGLGELRDPFDHVAISIAAGAWKAASDAEDDFAIHIKGMRLCRDRQAPQHAQEPDRHKMSGLFD